MKTQLSLFTVAMMLGIVIAHAQQNPRHVKDSLKNFVYRTDTIFENQLVTDRAFNMFLQKKTSYYLTGASEISVSKMYAAYTSDNDKFNFGVNFKCPSDQGKLNCLLTPMIESNIKKSFATVYEKGKWQSDIRIGAKLSLFSGGKISYSGMDMGSNQETAMIIVRNKELADVLKKINEVGALETDQDDTLETLLKKSLCVLKREADSIGKSADKKKADVGQRTSKYLDGLITKLNDYKTAIETIQRQIKGKTAIDTTKKELNAKTATSVIDSTKLKNDILLTRIDSLKRQRSLYLETLSNKIAETDEELLDTYTSQIATAEVDALYKKGSYNHFRNFWFSAWGFLPLTQRKVFMAADNTQSFEGQKMKLWEFNVQANGIWEWNNKVSIYLYAGWKIFQNNTALADLMTSVDYYQYSQFPPTDATQNNLAVLDNNKAYIGEFKEFITHSLNGQLVFSLSNTKGSGEERFCTPGISIYGEKNIGNYSALDLRFGVPLRFRGKSTPINIEPQVRLNDINNYSHRADYKLQPVLGINVGLPFTALFE